MRQGYLGAEIVDNTKLHSCLCMDSKHQKLIVVIILGLFIGFTIFMRLGFVWIQPHNVLTDQESQIAILPALNITRGMQPHFSESALLSYIIVFPYLITKNWLTVYEIAGIIKILMAVISAILIFTIVKSVTQKNTPALFAVGIFSIQTTAVLTQGLLIYSGDLFTPILTVASIWLLVKYSDNKDLKYLVSSLALLGLAFIIWTGGWIALVCYFGTVVILLLWNRLTPRKLLILAFMATVLLYTVYNYLPRSLNYGPPFLNVNLNSVGFWNVILFNIYTLLTQQMAVLVVPLFLAIGIVNFLFIYWGPICYGLFEGRFLKNKMFIAMLVMLILSMPIVLTDSRYESLIILPMAIIAGVCAKYTLPIFFKTDQRKIIFVLVLLLMVATAIFGTWLIGGLE